MSDERDTELMDLAFAAAARCVPVASAYNVGAVLTTPEKVIIATGYSRETGSHEHAEEVAFAKAEAQGLAVRGAYLYVSLEPCGTRMSKPRSCSALAVERGIAQVFYGSLEPALFVKEQSGLALLRKSGVTVVGIPGFEARFRQMHPHLFS